jgi:hypothetical protein
VQPSGRLRCSSPRRRIAALLEQLVHYLQGLSPASRASILGALSALFIIQALKRYEGQSVFAFFLALTGMAFFWLAFTTVYWSW